MGGSIRYANAEELGALIDLWAHVFGDDEGLVARFAQLWPCEAHAFVLHRGSIESALWDIDVGALCGPGLSIPLKMVYALATAPEHRGKGSASALMAALPGFDGLRCLTPAEASLAGWYKKLGWRDFFYCDRGCAVHSGGNTTAEHVNTEAYLSLRETYLADRIHDVPNSSAADWQRALFDTYGGGFYKITTPYGIAAACALKNDEGISVSELLSPPQARSAALDGLMNAFNAKQVNWRAPAECEPVAFAMVPKQFVMPVAAPKQPWLGFVFD